MSGQQIIVGAGAVTSVGFDFPTTLAAIHSGVDCFQDTFFVDDMSLPIIGAKIPDLDQLEEPGSERFKKRKGGSEVAAKYISMAIEEAIDPVVSRLSETNLLILIEPEAERKMGRSGDLLQKVRKICESENNGLVFSRSESIVGDATGIVKALRFASKWLEKYGNGHVVIAAYDSWLNNASINKALNDDRIKSEENGDGFIPGETAAAITIRNKSPRENGSSSVGELEIKGIGIGSEEASLTADQLCTGKGLSKAMQQAFNEAGVQVHQTNRRITNISGEEYFFNESAYAWARLLRKLLPEDYLLELPASSIGDVGCAFGPFLLGYAWHSIGKTKSEPRNCLIQLSSATNTRCAIVASSVSLGKQ